MSARAPAQRRLTGRHMLLATLAFFAVVIAANLAFVFLALDSFSGTVSDRAYQEGLAYNEKLAAAAEQQSRGWRGDLSLDSEGIVLSLRDREEQPVTGLGLEARLSRPATRAFDLTLPLVEASPGHYTAAVALDPGAWLIVVEGSDEGGRSFRTEGRLWR